MNTLQEKDGEIVRDPFVAYVIEHDLENDHFGLSRDILKILSDGAEHRFSEILEATGRLRVGLARTLKFLMALSAKNFEVFGFKVVKQKRKGETFYKLELSPSRGDTPTIRDRKHASTRQPDATRDISENLGFLRRRIDIALMDFGINDVKINDRPKENFDSKVSAASWFLYDEKRRAVIDMFTDAANLGHSVSTLWICEKLDIPNIGNHFPNLDRDTHRKALELGFVVTKVGGGYYALFELEDGSRKKALMRKYGKGFEVECTYLDSLSVFNHKELVKRLDEFYEEGYEEICVKRRDLTLNIAAAQRKNRNITVKEAAASIGQKSVDFTADWIRDSRVIRYKSGFYLRYRSDNKLECCLLDENADAARDIKPKGVITNY